MSLLVAPSVMILLLFMVSVKVLSSALSFFSCILMTSVIAANYLAFTFLQMTLIFPFQS